MFPTKRFGADALTLPRYQWQMRLSPNASTLAVVAGKTLAFIDTKQAKFVKGSPYLNSMIWGTFAMSWVDNHTIVALQTGVSKGNQVLSLLYFTASSGQIVRRSTIEELIDHTFSFSNNGQLLAGVSANEIEDGIFIRVVDVADQSIANEFRLNVQDFGQYYKPKPGAMYNVLCKSLEFSPDQRSLIGLVCIEDTTQEVSRFELEHEASLLIRWNLENNEQIFCVSVPIPPDSQLVGYEEWHPFVKISNDRKYILIAWGSVYLISYNTGKSEHVFDPSASGYTDAAFSTDAKNIFAVSSTIITCFEIRTQSVVRTVTFAKEHFARYLVVAPDVIALTNNTYAEIISTETLSPVKRSNGHTDSVEKCMVHTLARKIVSADNYAIKCWDLDSGALLWHRQGASPAHCLSPDGDRLIAITQPKEISILDSATGQQVQIDTFEHYPATSVWPSNSEAISVHTSSSKEFSIQESTDSLGKVYTIATSISTIYPA